MGGAGNDTYYFSPGDGWDYIMEGDMSASGLPGGTDVVKLGPGITASDVLICDAGADLIISINTTSEQIMVQGHNSGDPSRQIERVELADGTVIWGSPAQPVEPVDDWQWEFQASQVIDGSSWNDYLWGSPGSDKIYGRMGDDTLNGSWGADLPTGGAGSDALQGGADDDMYLLETGDGFDSIREGDGSYPSGVDTLRLGVGIVPDDVMFWAMGPDLMVLLRGTGDQIRVEGQYSGDPAKLVERFAFANGTVFSQGQVNDLLELPASPWNDYLCGSENGDTAVANDGSDTIYGNGGADRLSGEGADDNLYGGSGDDQLNGGPGYDWLYGGSGDDLYLLNRGDGGEFITEGETYGQPGGEDMIQLGSGIAANEVMVQAMGSDLWISIQGSSDYAVVQGQYSGDISRQVEWVILSDGTVVFGSAPAQIDGSMYDDYLGGSQSSESMNGDAGNDTLYGYGGRDTLSGGAGYDNLYGGLGSDTYLYNRGDGFDTVSEGDLYSPGGGTDTIQFGPTIS
ncbi:MAG TPA: calcium-binding protein [Candidatus Obscuribacterales bacterium]